VRASEIQSIVFCGNYACLYVLFSGLPCVLARESECMLIGAAILGACASGDFPSVQVSTFYLRAAAMHPVVNFRQIFQIYKLVTVTKSFLELKQHR